MTKKDDSKKDDQAPAAETESPPKPKTLVDYLRDEHGELEGRLIELDEFLASTDFTVLDREERERLQGQRTAMGHYHGILEARIAYHKAKGTK